MRRGDLVERAAEPSERTGRERKPRDEADAPLRAGVEHPLGRSILEVVAVLYRGDRNDLERALELLRVHVREPYEPYLALLAQRCDRLHRSLERDLPVDRVQLVEVDPIDPEPAEAPLARLPQVLRAAVRLPPPRPGADEAALGGDCQVIGIGV